MRYADDFVILARYQGQRLQEWVERTVEDWLGLRINREKTRVVNLNAPGASLDFLGYTFRYFLDLHGRGTRYLNVAPSKGALQRERAKLRALIGPAASHVPIKTLIQEVNQQVRGWAGYFGYGYPGRPFERSTGTYRNVWPPTCGGGASVATGPREGVSGYEHLRQQGLVYL